MVTISVAFPIVANIIGDYAVDAGSQGRFRPRNVFATKSMDASPAFVKRFLLLLLE